MRHHQTRLMLIHRNINYFHITLKIIIIAMTQDVKKYFTLIRTLCKNKETLNFREISGHKNSQAGIFFNFKNNCVIYFEKYNI